MHGLVPNRKKKHLEHTHTSRTPNKEKQPHLQDCLHTGMGMLVFL